MNIKINNKEVELKFTFNSFKYMKDFDFKIMEEIESKPFLIIDVLTGLLIGAVNNSKDTKITPMEVSDYVESLFEENSDISPTELMEILSNELINSSFFKSLQVIKTKKSKK